MNKKMLRRLNFALEITFKYLFFKSNFQNINSYRWKIVLYLQNLITISHFHYSLFYFYSHLKLVNKVLLVMYIDSRVKNYICLICMYFTVFILTIFMWSMMNLTIELTHIISITILWATRMSLFFFRLHNLQREEANKKKKKAELRQRRGARVFKRVSNSGLSCNYELTTNRLFEKASMIPSDRLDSLDEIALQIPRWCIFEVQLP